MTLPTAADDHAGRPPPVGDSARIDPGIATLAASVLLGMVGRVMARHFDAPAALWIVPAVLPLLPGLQIVTAMLASTDAARAAGLVGAAITASSSGPVSPRATSS